MRNRMNRESNELPKNVSCFLMFVFLVDKFVTSEINAGIPAEKIVIGGFSQGGAVALYHALTRNRQYGGVVALSTWLPLHTQISDILQIPKNVPIFQCHGTWDCIIPITMGKMTHEKLKSFELSKCEFTEYSNLQHSSSSQVILL